MHDFIVFETQRTPWLAVSSKGNHAFPFLSIHRCQKVTKYNKIKLFKIMIHGNYFIIKFLNKVLGSKCDHLYFLVFGDIAQLQKTLLGILGEKSM